MLLHLCSSLPAPLTSLSCVVLAFILFSPPSFAYFWHFFHQSLFPLCLSYPLVLSIVPSLRCLLTTSRSQVHPPKGAVSKKGWRCVLESKRKHTTEIPKELPGVPPHGEPYLEKMSIPLSRSCWEKGGYSDSYLNAIPGPTSRHPLISLKLVGHLINLKLPSQTLWQLAGRSVFCLTWQTTYEKDWIS